MRLRMIKILKMMRTETDNCYYTMGDGIENNDHNDGASNHKLVSTEETGRQ